jgi:hypothetical protein
MGIESFIQTASVESISSLMLLFATVIGVMCFFRYYKMMLAVSMLGVVSAAAVEFGPRIAQLVQDSNIQMLAGG